MMMVLSKMLIMKNVEQRKIVNHLPNVRIYHECS